MCLSVRLAVAVIISDIPNAYVYEIPDSDQRLWIAIPKAMDNNVNAIKGGEIFIYQVSNMTGMHRHVHEQHSDRSNKQSHKLPDLKRSTV